MKSSPTITDSSLAWHMLKVIINIIAVVYNIMGQVSRFSKKSIFLLVLCMCANPLDLVVFLMYDNIIMIRI